MIESIDFNLLDEEIKIKYLDRIFNTYPYNLYEKKQGLLSDILSKKIVVWAIIRDSELKGLMLTYITNDKILNASLFMDIHTMIQKDLEEMDLILVDHAQKNKCDLIEVGGRKGWEKLGKKYGYNFSSTLMHKVI